MKPRIVIINGPNLNLLGRREPGVYGSRSFEDYLVELRKRFAYSEIEYFQSNCEGEIIDRIHAEGFGQAAGIVLNPGAYAHYSYAIADAIASVETPVVEVHISNIHAREEFRHRSVISRVCAGCLCGFGLEGYALAVRRILDRLFATPVS